MSALAQPHSSLVRADTTEISKNPKFFTPKSVVVRLSGTPSPLAADVFYGRPFIRIAKNIMIPLQYFFIYELWTYR